MTILDPEVEEVAQQRHGRHHPDVCLTIEGEDRQEKDRVAMEMKGPQPAVAEDGVEEVGERGDKPCDDATNKEGIEGAA